ncbi:MAG: YihA family ribosome biogenesis GTP-binding protein [Erysipelotrichaceae bacterium]|nr:YihA family ribosome biogenesis GTP-binding protein [Erysipelotrichaceae bacterium]
MQFHNASFITSCATKDQWMIDDIAEVCFVGKSNVGKSTLINTLVSSKKLAKTSKTPGCTKLLNFFNIDNQFRLVDSPGYGYAKTNHQTYDDFAALMTDYLFKRENLKLVVHLVDSRHVPTSLDVEMYEMLLSSGKPFLIVATKSDKLNQSMRDKCKKNIISVFHGLKPDKIILVSHNDNLDNLKSYIEEAISRE